MELVDGSATFQYLNVDHLGTPIVATTENRAETWAGGEGNVTGYVYSDRDLWTYDTIGNRLTEVRDGQPADIYDYLENLAGGNLPQLDTILLGGGGTRAYLYDEVGNQTQVASGANVVDFAYDDASRLARIQRASASASTDLRPGRPGEPARPPPTRACRDEGRVAARHRTTVSVASPATAN